MKKEKTIKCLYEEYLKEMFEMEVIEVEKKRCASKITSKDNNINNLV